MTSNRVITRRLFAALNLACWRPYAPFAYGWSGPLHVLVNNSG